LWVSPLAIPHVEKHLGTPKTAVARTDNLPASMLTNVYYAVSITFGKGYHTGIGARWLGQGLGDGTPQLGEQAFEGLLPAIGVSGRPGRRR
jgi:hypothetical protein